MTSKVRSTGTTTIFYETLVSPKVAESLAREAGVRTAVLDPLEGLTDKEQQAGRSYISIMRRTSRPSGMRSGAGDRRPAGRRCDIRLRTAPRAGRGEHARRPGGVRRSGRIQRIRQVHAGRVALGLAPPASGEVHLFGAPPAAVRDKWRVGYVPQRPVVVDQLPATVEEVVASGCVARRGWARRSRPEDRRRIERALDVVALDDLRRTPIVELSGGQQQRGFTARALVSEPELLVLDEPIAGVDAESQSRFRDALVSRCRTDGVTVLLVSHELGAVAEDLDWLVLLRSARPSARLAPSGPRCGGQWPSAPARWSSVWWWPVPHRWRPGARSCWVRRPASASPRPATWGAGAGEWPEPRWQRGQRPSKSSRWPVMS